MEKPRQTICLNMIVKNEGPVIRRCLDSLRGFIDAWVIVDTGSTDGTQEILREHLRHLPGELIERPWVNFAHNRSEALEYARGQADYVFVIDADEVLEFDSGFALPALTFDAYHFHIHSGGFAYFKTQLVRNSLHWCFKNVLHEYIYSEEAKTEAVLEGVRTLRHPDGARARDPHTYRRDALVLENALIEEPNNSRNVFYLAQSYRDAQEPELAIRHYQRRVELGGWIEEVWYSLYQIAEIKQNMGAEWPMVQDAYLRAYQTKPDRAGPLYKIGIHYQWKKEHALAYLYFRQAMDIPYPKGDRLFIEKALYDYMLPLEYAVCCYYVGRHAEAIETNNRLLLGGDLPAHLIAQVIKNRRFSLDALHPRVKTPSAAGHRIKVCIPFHNPGPHLDNCVESLLQQSYKNFEAIFIDDASESGYAEKIPADDSRFRLLHNHSHQGRAACLHRCVTEFCDVSAIVFPLDGVNWLCGADALERVDRLFREYAPRALYGQHRFSSGHLGLAAPLSGPAALESIGLNQSSGLMPVVFRASLCQKIAPADLSEAVVLQTAGFEGICFNDEPIVVVNLETEAVELENRPLTVPMEAHAGPA